MDRFLSVGPIVYFVQKGDFNFEEEIQQGLICSSVGCSPHSLGSQIATAAKYPERYIFFKYNSLLKKVYFFLYFVHKFL